MAVHHAPPVGFTRGQALSLTLARTDMAGVRLHDRRLDQAGDYVTVAMEPQGGQCGASIPAAYTQTVFPLHYLFEVSMRFDVSMLFEVSMHDGRVGLHPGFTAELTNQP